MDLHNLTHGERIEARKQHLRPDFPYSYSVSLGEFKCNISCRMCPMYNMPPKKNRFITDAVFQRACEELGEREASYEISAWGETFQHSRADDYLFIARQVCPNANIVVATNGMLLNEARCEKIVDSGIDHLSFSVDTGSAETYRWLTGSGQYDRVCRNLETLASVREKRGGKHLMITAHIIGIKELAHEFEMFEKRWSPFVDRAYVRQYGNWAGMVDDNGITPAEKQVVLEQRYPCTWLWYATKIEPNGDVSKCFVHVTGDSDPLGNIMEQSFESIWKGEKMRRLRELHRRNAYNDIDLCGDCSVWALFPKLWRRRRLASLLGAAPWA